MVKETTKIPSSFDGGITAAANQVSTGTIPQSVNSPATSVAITPTAPVASPTPTISPTIQAIRYARAKTTAPTPPVETTQGAQAGNTINMTAEQYAAGVAKVGKEKMDASMQKFLNQGGTLTGQQASITGNQVSSPNEAPAQTPAPETPKPTTETTTTPKPVVPVSAQNIDEAFATLMSGGTLADTRENYGFKVVHGQFNAVNNLDEKTLGTQIANGTITPQMSNLLARYNPAKFAAATKIANDTTAVNNINTNSQRLYANATGTTPQTTERQSDKIMNEIMTSQENAGSYSDIVAKAYADNPDIKKNADKLAVLDDKIDTLDTEIDKMYETYRTQYPDVPQAMLMGMVNRATYGLTQERNALVKESKLLYSQYKDAKDMVDMGIEYDIKQEENRMQRLEWLYGKTRDEEIRQEDFTRADKLLADEIARADKKDAETLARLEQERLDNVKTAIAQLGVTPVGKTYDELLGEYAEAVKNQPKEDKITTGLKAGDYYLDNGELKQVPSQGQAGNPQNIAQYSIDKRGRTNLQCGELTNDYWEMATGTKMGVGNSYDSKLQAIKKAGESPVPVEGGIFAFPAETFAGNTGHIGIVQTVNEDGSITVLEANRAGKKEGTEPQLNTYTAEQVKKMKFSQPPATPLDSNQTQIANTEKSAFRSNPVVKSFEEGLQQYQDIVVSLGDQTGPGDTAGIFQFMKSLDPQSVVRETEFESAAKSAGVASYMGNTYDRIMKGKKLTPEQALAFKRLAKAYVENRAKNYDRLYDDMARSMTNQGIHESYLPTRATLVLSQNQTQTPPKKEEIQSFINEAKGTIDRKSLIKKFIQLYPYLNPADFSF